MAKMNGILLLLVCFLASFAAHASDHQNLLGVLHVIDGGNNRHAGAQIIEMRTRAVYRIGIQRLTPSAFALLRNFNGMPTEIKAFRYAFEEATFRSLGDPHYSFTIWPDGVLYFGPIHLKNGKPEIVVINQNGPRHLALKGAIVQFAPDFFSGDVSFEGFLRDDGQSIEVSRLKRENPKGPETLLASGILNSAIAPTTRQREYYIEEPNGRKLWIKEPLSSKMDGLIGTQVFSTGKYTAAGQLDPQILQEELSVDDLNCAERLMNNISATQKEFQANWKKQK